MRTSSMRRSFMRPSLLPVLLVAVMFTLAGCGGGREVSTAPALTGVPTMTSTTAYTTVEINRFTTLEGLGKYQGFADMVHDALLQRLPGEGLYAKVTNHDPAASGEALIIEGKVTRVKSVSKAKRFALGMMAGRAGLEMQISLKDKASGKVLASNVILVKGSITGGMFSSSNRQTINMMTKEMISYLRSTK